MAYKVVYTHSFIADYVRVQSSLSAARKKKLADSIDREIDTLSRFPYIHAVSQKPILHSHQMREAYVLDYALLYNVPLKRVFLLRLFHQRQNYTDSAHWDCIDI